MVTQEIASSRDLSGPGASARKGTENAGRQRRRHCGISAVVRRMATAMRRSRGRSQWPGKNPFSLRPRGFAWRACWLMSDSRSNRAARVACDSLVALGNATASGNVLFAKNSDRPANEPQPLVLLPRRRHAPGERLHCQYIEIPEVAETARVIGSRPFWLWGLEHGVNEHGVAIGNHTVFTRDPLEGKGLIGMDLVRLGLERATNARSAVDLLCGLIERYGQGGSGYADKEWPYHNSFLIADRREAFLLETSDRLWALRAIADVGSASNHVSIGDDWTALAAGTIEHAIASGWWPEDASGRFDFAAAYRDESMAPAIISSGRHRRTCELLAEARGKITPASFRTALRDHYGSPFHRPGRTLDDERYFSVCMHADPVGTTTASLVAELPANEGDLPRCWTSLGSPCVGVFLPCYIDGELPVALSRAGAEPSGDSPWWRFKALLTLVERDFERFAPRVRASWDELEASILKRAEEVEAEALEQLHAGRRDRASEALTRFMAENLAVTVDHLEQLIRDLGGA
jgi:secernin